MQLPDNELAWRRFWGLFAPVHDGALVTARRLCRSSDDGSDLFQEAVLRAFEKLHTLRDETRFRSWFYAVLLSVHRTRARRSFWKRFLSFEGMADQRFDPTGDDLRVRTEDEAGAERAARALALLPDVQREAIILFELEGFSIEEVAALQSSSISAVKSRLARGRSRLRRHYEKVQRHDSFRIARAEADPTVDASTPLPAGKRS